MGRLVVIIPASLVFVLLGASIPLYADRAIAQVCFMIDSRGETINLDNLCRRSNSYPQSNLQSHDRQATREFDLNWMRDNCNNLNAQNRFVEPSANSSEACRQAFREWSERVQNSSMCRQRNLTNRFLNPGIEDVIDRNCNRFVRGR